MLLFLLGCVATEPLFVNRADIDRSLTKGDLGAVCAGLRMKDDDVREYAAEKLVDQKSATASCICDHLTREGRWDPGVLKGLHGKHPTERLACVAALLDDPAQVERPGLATAMLNIRNPAVRARLVAAAASDADPAVQAAAVAVYTDTKDPAEISLLVSRLPTAEPAWGVAAALVLTGAPAATDVLRAAASDHADKRVRAAALTAFQASQSPDWPDVVCRAMMEDPAGDVRAAAVRATRSSRDPKVMACVRKRSVTEEADSVVRKALLETLKVAPAPEAARILCDAIPFWVAHYVTDKAVEEQSDQDILYFHNVRDYDHSYSCTQAALRGSGYSCWGRAYLGARFRDYGGKANWPPCEGRGGGDADLTVRFGE